MASLNNLILVPIDFSAQSIVALEQSYNLARLTKAEITLIHVIEEQFQLPFFSKSDNNSVEKKNKKGNG
jgi:nucleotide-binding universal stress UspA family protein